MISRARRLVVALVSGILGRAVGMLVPLVVMGPMLNHLGPVYSGIWLAAVSLSTMVVFLDFGVGNAVLTRLADAYGRDDTPAAHRILGEAYALLGGIAGGLMLLVWGGVLVAREAMPDLVDAEYATVTAIVLTGLFLSFPGSLIYRMLQARHAFVQSQLTQIVGPFASLVLCLAAIAADMAPTVVVAIYSLTPAVALLVWSAVYFVLNRSDRPAFKSLDTQSMRGLLSLGGAFFVVSVFSLSGLNADNVIISMKAAAEVVVEHGVPARLGSILLVMVGTMFMPLWPLFGDALARRDRAWLVKTTWIMSLGGATAVFLVGLGLTWFAEPVMVWWVGRPYRDQQLVLLGWTFAATVVALATPFAMVLNAAGKARQQIMPWVAFVAVTFCAKFLLITASTAWYAPWITAVAYAVLIAPQIFRIAFREFRGIGPQGHQSRQGALSSL